MSRIEVLKTHKLYIGGQFPRTESGRYYAVSGKNGKQIANFCLASRKDFRNAVVAARGAFGGWSARTALNRSQILYRIAEMLEGRKAQFVSELIQQGSSAKIAETEVNLSIDRLIYFAGWCDKYQQIFSAVNPVASSHFNFSVPESMGVISIIAPEENSLIGLVSTIAPVIAGGNSCIVLASENKPLCAVSFSEVLNSSDVPAGVVNILTGKSSELHSHFASHMDVNALIYCRENSKERKNSEEYSTLNLKRVFIKTEKDWLNLSLENPYQIMETQEIKTTWHPIESIGSAKASY